jgi:WD40 repeat protein
LTTFFQGHKSYVVSLVLSAETLYSCSSDRSLRSWDVKTQESVQSFQSKSNSKSFELLALHDIYAILITEDLIVACTGSGIELFSISSGQKAIFSPG